MSDTRLELSARAHHDLPFDRRWLARFGLPRSDWRVAVQKEIGKLPFCEPEIARTLLAFLFADLPKLLKAQPDPELARLSEAFAWVCFSFWQCESAFPAFPENYALFLRDEITKPAGKRDPDAIALAELLVPGADGRCGFNRLALSDPAAIRESETLMYEGRYEFYLKAREKYAEYESYLAHSAQFRVDWERIKACFPGQLRGEKIARRSLIPERNWERGPGARFTDAAQRFQAVFDLFCWKYYLWGMKDDQPLLLKTSVVFTPYGTQLFVPGYLSFDPKRDIDFSKVMRLHRARGIARQGPGFSTGRRELAELRRKAKAADREARRRGLKGEARYRWVCGRINFRDEGDYRRLRKLLQEILQQNIT
jgi:hypothetical protein